MLCTCSAQIAPDRFRSACYLRPLPATCNRHMPSTFPAPYPQNTTAMAGDLLNSTAHSRIPPSPLQPTPPERPTARKAQPKASPSHHSATPAPVNPPASLAVLETPPDMHIGHSRASLMSLLSKMTLTDSHTVCSPTPDTHGIQRSRALPPTIRHTPPRNSSLSSTAATAAQMP